jgi:large subunit ribosomal protein L10
MVQPAKMEKVEELKRLIQESKSVILNDFTGLNVADISELRRQCHENSIDFRVVKNTLARRSFNELGIEGMDALLEGPTAIAVSAVDEVAPAHVIKKFADEYKLPSFKGGYVAGRILDEKETVRLSSLPSRGVILAQVVGTFQAPLRGLVGVLSASMRDLVGVLDAIKEKKGAA